MWEPGFALSRDVARNATSIEWTAVGGKGFSRRPERRRGEGKGLSRRGNRRGPSRNRLSWRRTGLPVRGEMTFPPGKVAHGRVGTTFRLPGNDFPAPEWTSQEPAAAFGPPEWTFQVVMLQFVQYPLTRWLLPPYAWFQQLGSIRTTSRSNKSNQWDEMSPELRRLFDN